MEYDMVVVGAGPAGLATAIKLRQLSATHGKDVKVCVVEKGAEVGTCGACMVASPFAVVMPHVQMYVCVCVLYCVIAGAHILSGNVFDPRSLTELIPDWKAKDAPLTTKVKQDKFFFLTETSSYPYASFGSLFSLSWW